MSLVFYHPLFARAMHRFGERWFPLLVTCFWTAIIIFEQFSPRSGNSNAIFIFFFHSGFPHKTVHPFWIFLAVLPPPPYTMLKPGKKFWIHASNVVCGVRGGVGPVWIGKRPEMQKCPKTFFHDCRLQVAPNVTTDEGIRMGSESFV